MERANGAKRALIPIENKRDFLDVSADIVKHVDPIFFGDPKTAALKAMGGHLTDQLRSLNGVLDFRRGRG